MVNMDSPAAREAVHHMRKQSLPQVYFGSVLLLLLALASASASAGAVLEQARKAGVIRCGVSEGIPGFSLHTNTRWEGLDVDYCRALAVAVFGKPDAVQFVPLNVADRFDALRSGSIDVLSRNSTWTISREAEFDIAFVGIIFFDGQGFLARRDGGARYALELGGARVCVKPDTTSQRNLDNYFALNAMRYTAVSVSDFDAMRSAFEDERCDVVTSDQSQLHALRSQLEQPASARVLPEFISKEPLAPAVPAGDPEWRLLARLVLAMLINAEEVGIDSKNVQQIAKVAKSEQIRGLLDLDHRFAKRLGLSEGWAPRTIETLGNYGEIFARTLGAGSPLDLKRGQNALWNRGGLLYAPRIN